MKKIIFLSTSLLIALIIALPTDAISQQRNKNWNNSPGLGQGNGYGKKRGICDSTQKRLRLRDGSCINRNNQNWNGQKEGNGRRLRQQNRQPENCIYFNNIQLSPAYPNPFQNSITIPIALTEDKDVSIKVYDLNGNLISTVHEGNLPKAEHNFTFTPSNLTAGRYIYVVKSGNLTRSRYIHYQP
ncbi:MAG: T9SS type A sorting domain-containing protein [Ignavibacteria bacterium]|nr:T9SS type A sorting domain-containing protein [Ignavibacteria bacterium]